MALSKSHLNRLSRVHASLTPKQLVLQDVLEAAKYPSFVEYAAAVGEGRVLCGDTLMDRIGRSVKTRRKYSSRMDEQAAVRRAQQEGLFLGKLVCFCNAAVLESAEAWRLRTVCGATMVLVIAHAETFDDTQLELVVASAGHLYSEFYLEVSAHQRAAEQISKTYFDGMDVLHPSARRTLEHSLASLDGTLKPLSVFAFDDGPSEPAEYATRLVKEWVLLAKAMTHDAFGETASGIRMLGSLLKGR